MGPGPNVSLESLHNGLRCISHLDTNGYAYTRHGKASGEFDANHGPRPFANFCNADNLDQSGTADW